jgi:hypothetical protein
MKNCISKLSLLVAALYLLCTACSKQVTPVKSAAAIPGPACIVYKTRADYNRLVPVILSADKSKIISFPDIRDIYFNGHYACPTDLANGYLLDNRGIGPGVAFLKLTYDEYSRLAATPKAGELFKMILDKDPLTEMYECGIRSQYEDPVEAMNRLIRSGELPDHKRLK